MAIPNEPGYYWRKGRDEDDLKTCKVVEVGPLISTQPGELFYWVPGDIGAIYVQADSEYDTEWYGPIFAPDTLKALFDEMQEAFNLLDAAGISCESLPEGIQQIIKGGRDDQSQ